MCSCAFDCPFYYSSIKETRAVAQQLRYFVAERAVQKATLDRVAEESTIWTGLPRTDWVSLLPFFLISRPLYVHTRSDMHQQFKKREIAMDSFLTLNNNQASAS
jgi:hypothetical protein